MPLQATSGAASYDAFGGGAAAVVNYIEDVFSTFPYTGTGASLTINNGIDLSTKGGLVWQKDRPSAGTGHYWQDTARGVQKYVLSNTDAPEVTSANTITAFNTNGYTVGGNGNINGNGEACVSWTFRKQPKFFDIVTYTGNNTGGRTISHNLGAVPGCIIVKCLNGTDSWYVYHQSLGPTKYIILNQTISADTASILWNDTSPTSTNFTLGSYGGVNGLFVNYVAYLFASNAGGFGRNGTDNVISCGTFTTDSSGNIPAVNLGYEPQWILFKKSSGTAQNWFVFDTMRGLNLTQQAALNPNTNGSESLFTPTDYIYPTATGFIGFGNGFGVNTPFIYIAIRRGPMKVPTVGTSVFIPNSVVPSTTPFTITTGFPVDLTINNAYTTPNLFKNVIDRLRGTSTTAVRYLWTSSTSLEQSYSGGGLGFDSNTTIVDKNFYSGTGTPVIYWNFQRAPGFFDEVCWTAGSNSNARISHNLTVAPELIITKQRGSPSNSWNCYAASLGINGYIQLNATAGFTSLANTWGSSAPTTTDFGINEPYLLSPGVTQVAYLFATCNGVSKVGSYTGIGSTQTINCGFTGGARFVLIKRTDSTGDWYVWDTARGMVAGTDPSMTLNTTDAQVNANSVYTTGVGFEIVSTAAGINASGGTYIFLAVA